MDSVIFRPKGPLPLYLADFEADTVGWRAADRYLYLRVLDHMFHQGGFIPDDDGYLLEVMELRKGRGWRKTVALIRSKLTRLDLIDPETKAFANGLLTALQTVSYRVCLSQKRILRDVQKAKDRAAKSAKGGHAKAGTNPAPGKIRAVPPSPSLEGREGEGRTSSTDSPTSEPPPRKANARKSRAARYVFEGQVVRLTEAHFKQWQRSFPNILDLTGALQSRDDFLASKAPEDVSNWFVSTAAWLANRNEKAAAERHTPRGDGQL